MDKTAAPSRIVLLNGPAGVGKTTVGRELAGLVANGACVHGDQLAGFIVRRVEGAVTSGLGYTNGAILAANFVAAGYELVVFEYVFEHRLAVDRCLNALGTTIPVHLFTLWAPLATVVARERGRSDREPLGERVETCHRAIGAALPELGYRIDNVDASPCEVARAIRRLCEADVGRIDRAPTANFPPRPLDGKRPPRPTSQR